jgi:hypothetical protein
MNSYLVIEGEVIDNELGLLQSLFGFVDERLDVEWQWARKGIDFPENANFYAGLGFVSCQKYLAATCGEVGATGRQLRRGPMFNDSYTVIEVLNAAANAWKHSDQWSTPPKGPQLRTETVIEDVLGEDWSETWLLDVLVALVGHRDARFKELVGPLTMWRDELFDDLGVLAED